MALLEKLVRFRNELAAICMGVASAVNAARDFPCALDRLGAGAAPALAPVLVELNNIAVAMKLLDMELPLFVGMISEVGVADAKIETQIEADLKRRAN
jgi:hypothetical protein